MKYVVYGFFDIITCRAEYITQRYTLNFRQLTRALILLEEKLYALFSPKLSRILVPKAIPIA